MKTRWIKTTIFSGLLFILLAANWAARGEEEYVSFSERFLGLALYLGMAQVDFGEAHDGYSVAVEPSFKIAERLRIFVRGSEALFPKVIENKGTENEQIKFHKMYFSSARVGARLDIDFSPVIPFMAGSLDYTYIKLPEVGYGKWYFGKDWNLGFDVPLDDTKAVGLSMEYSSFDDIDVPFPQTMILFLNISVRAF